jgi:lysozyme
MEKLKRMLELHEGKKDFGYMIDGKLHIGIGRNIDVDGGLGLSDEEIRMLLDNDIVRTMRELAGSFEWYSQLDEVRQDALVMIAFNLGLTRLRKFVLALTALEEGNYVKAKIEFLDSLWSTQVGQRAVTLATMIETGEYPDGE